MDAILSKMVLHRSKICNSRGFKVDDGRIRRAAIKRPPSFTLKPQARGRRLGVSSFLQ